MRCTALQSQASWRSARVSGAILICHHKVNVSGGVMQRQVKRPSTRILNLQFHLRARLIYVGTSRWAGEAWHFQHCPDDTVIVDLVESRRTEAKEEHRQPRITPRVLQQQCHTATCSNAFQKVPIFVPDSLDLLMREYCAALKNRAVSQLLNGVRFMASSTSCCAISSSSVYALSLHKNKTTD